MGPGRFVARALVALVALAMVAPGCADGGNGGGRDGGRGEGGTGMDGGGGGVDAQTPDAGEPDTSIGTDAGPREIVGTCETCDEDLDCADGSYCAMLVSGGSACLPGCNPDLPDCPSGTPIAPATTPRPFSCIFDASGTGVDATICAPVGGPCCVDEDGDGYGIGVGCLGEDCNDMDAVVHPDRTEICDGIDTNCNRTTDESPNDCESGRCDAQGDGTYESITGGVCTSAACGSGTMSDCGLYTCSEGGDEGTSCATACAPTGTDDDTFCIASAHCDAGACVPDIPDGMSCDEDTDCTAAHCDNDFCCSTGTCCNTVTDCPGGGGVTRICEDPMSCQGARGMTECNATFQCATVAGIPDDTGCSTTTLSRSCGLYDDIFCNGTAVQTARACPTSCLSDGDCIEAAHCTIGFCVPDLPAGGPCGRPQDCLDGLSCTDGVCCMTACNGACEACDLPGTAGTCTTVPSGGDPDSECAGFPCSGYYDGFSGGDQCFRRSDVSDGQAVCNGAGACVGAASLCPTQPRGPLQVDCHDTCQTPRGATCTGTVSGICDNNDATAGTRTCGVGRCLTTVPACTGGMTTSCTPGSPVVETCNGMDDDCDMATDNGTGVALCGAIPQATGVACTAGTCSFSGCASTHADVDGSVPNGCECALGQGGPSCASAQGLGPVSVGGSLMASGAVAPGDSRWFIVSFPPNRGAYQQGAGRPHIQLTGASSGTHTMQITTSCAAGDTTFCNLDSPTQRSAVTNNWEFFDDQAIPGPEQWNAHGHAWPETIYIRVTRLSAATTCAQAGFQLTINR